MTQITPNERLLKALAVAFVEHPRGTLKELAEAAGISKATLHRLCGTRDRLVEMLIAHGLVALTQVIRDANLEQADPLAALRALIQGHLNHRELLAFMVFQYRPDSLSACCGGEDWRPYFDAMDGFFLKGQQAGIFRIDISAHVLTELFDSILYGIIDAERRGRAASASSAVVLETFFLHGCAVHSP